jgi:hypothetical protein
MWSHYKSTFVGTQLMILAVTAAIYFCFGRVTPMALVFYVTMQIGSLAGAGWAARLRRRAGESRDRLPLKACG